MMRDNSQYRDGRSPAPADRPLKKSVMFNELVTVDDNSSQMKNGFLSPQSATEMSVASYRIDKSKQNDNNHISDNKRKKNLI